MGCRKRQLDDEELDSGDDAERTEQAPEAAVEEQPEYETREKTVLDLELPRQPIPEPSDGEVPRPLSPPSQPQPKLTLPSSTSSKSPPSSKSTPPNGTTKPSNPPPPNTTPPNNRTPPSPPSTQPSPPSAGATPPPTPPTSNPTAAYSAGPTAP